MTGETCGRENNEKGTAVTRRALNSFHLTLCLQCCILFPFSFCRLITIHRFLPCVPVFTILVVIVLYPDVISKAHFFLRFMSNKMKLFLHSKVFQFPIVSSFNKLRLLKSLYFPSFSLKPSERSPPKVYYDCLVCHILPHCNKEVECGIKNIK